MDMDFVYELVEVVFMSRAEVDERLNCLVGVGRDFLTLAGFNRLDRIIDEQGEVGDAVVNICGLVNADKGFVEDGKEVAEELESGWLRSLINVLLVVNMACLPPR